MLTLSSEGYVAKDPNTKKYRLGVRVLAFNNVITKNLEIYSESLPTLQDLVQKTGETAHIGILEETNLVYLHKVEPERPIRVFTETGKQAPCYCIAGGKAILAFQEEKTIERIIQAGLTPFTEKTITDPEILRTHLNEIRHNGYAISHGEYLKEGEIIAIAAPIYDYTGRVFASLSLIGIAQLITESRLNTYITQVKKAAKKISENLGYWGTAPF